VNRVVRKYWRGDTLVAHVIVEQGESWRLDSLRWLNPPFGFGEDDQVIDLPYDEPESQPIHPDVLHRRFYLDRQEDATGISGTGVVAEGVEFSDGVVAIRWLVPKGAPGHGNPTSVVFHDNGMESVEKIHGHGGLTKIVWVD